MSLHPQLLSLEVDIYWDDLPIGTRFHSRKRTVTETDLVNFVNLAWLGEELFANADPDDRANMSITGRVVPGALVYTFAEGLTTPSFQVAGLAFLGTTLEIQGPTVVGDTLYVKSEVIEHRLTSNPSRGLVRTRNEVVNQRGQTVLTYCPLRLMSVRETAALQG
ncbi:MaoC family dehydratase N-terminal domain-containing protein [Pseudomonas sp. H9]|uniref:FAS1-like dehydratase domain-containing protein n=1 Tax=Pseudomonas sp. H9 TaxID=483968 RepID=UPI0010580D1B|nr:MaoC family dehydratase N-terminal domain-containing protein [Pseudomonas sp. H9]TDF83779.1 acyl dehydratase [Pseudomonas sp. H9]